MPALAARDLAKKAVVTKVDDLPTDIREKKYLEAPNVGVAIKVISISHLDLADNTFQADFNINVAWCGKQDWAGEDKDALGELVQIYNQMEGEDPDVSEVKKGDGGFDWYFRVRYRGKFRQHYDLHQFPFDEQDLTVRVRLKKECQLVPLPWGPTGEAASVDPGAIEDDFILEEARVDHEYHPSYKFGKLGGYDPEALVIFRVRRKPEYWINNYGVIVSLICTFAFSAFALPVSDIGDRLGVGFTLNLTVVASFYLMQDKLPPVPYWTELDKHMVICIVFTMIVMSINCSPAILGEELVSKLERPIVGILMVLWIGYHSCQYVRMISMMTLTKEDPDANGPKKNN